MIFVTVGTHEQPFDRLLRYIDNMIENGKITENVVIQKGYTNYISNNFESFELIAYDEMEKYIDEARIVITHGGPSSFIAPLLKGKFPILVQNKKKYNEHVNDHQLEFAKEVEKRMCNIIVATSEEELIDAIINYDKKTKEILKSSFSNNKKFNVEFEKQIKEIMN